MWWGVFVILAAGMCVWVCTFTQLSGARQAPQRHLHSPFFFFFFSFVFSVPPLGGSFSFMWVLSDMDIQGLVSSGLGFGRGQILTLISVWRSCRPDALGRLDTCYACMLAIPAAEWEPVSAGRCAEGVVMQLVQVGASRPMHTLAMLSCVLLEGSRSVCLCISVHAVSLSAHRAILHVCALVWGPGSLSFCCLSDTAGCLSERQPQAQGLHRVQGGVATGLLWWQPTLAGGRVLPGDPAGVK